MDFHFKTLSAEKEHIGIAFCDPKSRLLGYAKTRPIIKKTYLKSAQS